MIHIAIFNIHLEYIPQGIAWFLQINKNVLFWWIVLYTNICTISVTGNPEAFFKEDTIYSNKYTILRHESFLLYYFILEYIFFTVGFFMIDISVLEKHIKWFHWGNNLFSQMHRYLHFHSFSLYSKFTHYTTKWYHWNIPQGKL